ncbi:MAG: ExbD/TolR family protein [Bradymonadia bacterium]
MNFQEGLKKRNSTVVDLTALVDVVFQLLIFFVLTSSYVNNQAPSMDVDLPSAAVEAPSAPQKNFTITIQADGTLVAGEEEQPVGIAELEVMLTRAANESPDTVVLIRGDQEVSYGKVVQVMGMAKALSLQVSVVYRNGG